VVAELTRSLDRMPDETLCMAAMRFVYAKPFVSSVITGMFHDVLLEDNYRALAHYRELRLRDRSALETARTVAGVYGPVLLPPRYRWLERQWLAG
jgi:aryl-alcohol dehydrogenase-like predicted oxidoreductase